MMVGEVSELLADEGDKASVLHYLDAAILNVNAWSGAEMRQCLNAARTAALQIELDGRSMYVCCCCCGARGHSVAPRVMSCVEGGCCGGVTCWSTVPDAKHSQTTAPKPHTHRLLCYFRV